MSGFNLITKIRKLEEECDKLGFVMCSSKYASHRDFGDVVALKPKDQDSVPIYTRDAELFSGTINDLEVWLRGVNWARDYDRMVFGNSHNDNRNRKEQVYRNKKLVQLIKGEKVD